MKPLPPLPEPLVVRRSAHGYHGTFTAAQMTEYGGQCASSSQDLLQELANIANADTEEWDDRTEFEAWAKSRARSAIAKATGSAV